jgi:hypothetical protein
MDVQELKNDGWVILPCSQYRDVSTKSGVYGLLMTDDIVYIGKSKCLFSRINHHRTCKKGEFDTIMYKLFPDDKIGEMETYYIKKFCPKQNIMGTPFDTKKHTSVKGIFRYNYVAGDMCGSSFTYVRPFKDTSHLKSILERYGYYLYQEQNRWCISKEDARTFIRRIDMYINDYIRNKFSPDNFLFDDPPRLLNFGVWVDREYVFQRLNDDIEAQQKRNEEHLRECRIYYQKLRDGEIEA